MTLTDVEKYCPKETPPSLRHKLNYRDDTNEKTHGTED